MTFHEMFQKTKRIEDQKKKKKKREKSETLQILKPNRKYQNQLKTYFQKISNVMKLKKN